jgi:hypothetical protein
MVTWSVLASMNNDVAGIDQDILRPEVTVHDPVILNVGECVTHVQRDADRTFVWELVSGQYLAQGLPVEPFGDDVVLAAVLVGVQLPWMRVEAGRP